MKRATEFRSWVPSNPLRESMPLNPTHQTHAMFSPVRNLHGEFKISPPFPRSLPHPTSPKPSKSTRHHGTSSSEPTTPRARFPGNQIPKQGGGNAGPCWCVITVVARRRRRLRVLRSACGSAVRGNLGCWRLMRGIMVSSSRFPFVRSLIEGEDRQDEDGSGRG